jgi:hypothetical protein
MKNSTPELRKQIKEKFNKVSDSADLLENEAAKTIEKYCIKDRKDKNQKWESIINDLNLSDDEQSALNLAVARVLRKIKKA